MRVYLDWNATAPPLAGVVEAMTAAARDAWANPSSVHADGRAARLPVEAARHAVAALGGVDARDCVLTSGGTEANNLAIRSAFAGQGSASVLVTSRLEHPSVTRVAEALEREQVARVRWLEVLPTGQISLEDLERALGEAAVRLVVLQAVNAETGVIQPVHEAYALTRKAGALLHVDAVQAWGKIEGAPEGDTMSLAAHKFRGPKGIGALLARPGIKVTPVLLGGSQEKGIRPGTVDPIAAAGLAVAARHALEGSARYARLAPLRDGLERELLALDPRASVNGAGAPRAPHVSSVAWPGWQGPEMVAALDLESVSVASGSACSAGTSEPSPVLEAMGGGERATSSVRISMGETTTAAEVEATLDAFRRVVRRGLKA